MNDKDVALYLYTKKNKSSRDIAEILQIDDSTVRKLTKLKGVSRRSIGLQVEDFVYLYFKKIGTDIDRKPSNYLYDFDIAGKRYDVKCATLNHDRPLQNVAYHFQIQDSVHQSNPKDFRNEIDYFLLVFLSEFRTPMYRVSTKVIKPNYHLRIKHPTRSKYPLEFIGNLDLTVESKAVDV